ncbi:DnaJ domain-containing protein [Zobellia uliginosa]|uniref:DnaJ domain-containing protein n=1 Tax=Zobellia uliginosa TaxID=143224 RepID=A0ABY1L2A0_9FLAO|nr:DnaJ domain-containing protein [Zobellia uliginosa]SIT16238.1 DnaJ domain-containing protein [Zobellia uliginosa]
MSTEIDGSKDYYGILGLDKNNLDTLYEEAKKKKKIENDVQIAKEIKDGKRQTTVKLTPEEIKKEAEAYVYSHAYRTIALQQHPDKRGDNGGNDKLIQAQEARDILQDPDKREKYDKKRAEFLRKESGPKTKSRARREGTKGYAPQGHQEQQEQRKNSSQDRYRRPQQQGSDEENIDLRKVIDDWENAYQILKHDFRNLRESNNSAKEKNKDLRKVIDNWKNAYQSLEESNNSAKEKNKDLRKVIDDWTRAFQRLEHAYQSLEESNNSAKEKNKDLRKVIDDWENAYQRLEHDFRNLGESNNSAKEENKKLKNKNRVLRNKINNLSEDYGSLEEENKKLKEKLQKYEQEGDKENRVNDLIIKIEGKIEELRNSEFELPTEIKQSMGYSNDEKKRNLQIRYDVEAEFFNKKKVEKYDFLNSIGKRISDNKHGLKKIDDRLRDLRECEKDIESFYGKIENEYNNLNALYKDVGPREERRMENFSNPQVVKNNISRSSSPNGSTSRGVRSRRI